MWVFGYCNACLIPSRILGLTLLAQPQGRRFPQRISNTPAEPPRCRRIIL